MKKYYITGVPGVGKSTVMYELQRRGFAAFDVDYTPGLCHWQHIETQEPVEFVVGADDEWHKAHSWFCDIPKLQNLMNSYNEDYLFVTGLTKNQADYFYLFDNVVLLHAEPATFLERMARRDSEHFGHNEQDRQSVVGWYKGFEDRIVAAGGIVIDSSSPVEQTVDAILEKLKVNPL